MIWEVLNTLRIEIQFRKRFFFLRKGKEFERQAGVAGDRGCQPRGGLDLPGHRHRRLHGQVGGHDLRDDHRLAAGEEKEGKCAQETFYNLVEKLRVKSPKFPGSPPAPQKGPCLDKTSRGPSLPPSLVPGEFHFIYMPMPPHPSTVYIHSPILPLEFSHSKKEFFRGIREPNNLRFFPPHPLSLLCRFFQNVSWLCRCE